MSKPIVNDDWKNRMMDKFEQLSPSERERCKPGFQRLMDKCDRWKEMGKSLQAEFECLKSMLEEWEAEDRRLRDKSACLQTKFERCYLHAESEEHSQAVYERLKSRQKELGAEKESCKAIYDRWADGHERWINKKQNWDEDIEHIQDEFESLISVIH